MTELSASTGSVVRTINNLVNGAIPYGISSDGTHVWVAALNTGTVTELSAATGAIIKNITDDPAPYGIWSDGTHVWVTNYSYNTVFELDASTGSLVQNIGLGSEADPDAVASDGTHAWVVDFGTSKVSEIAIGGATLGFRITTSSLPHAVPGKRYGPVTLHTAGAGKSAVGYTTTFQWSKVNLPTGLTLSSKGVLAGTPSTTLHAGSSSVKIKVTETVTTLSGKKKVETKKTVQATILLTIT